MKLNKLEFKNHPILGDLFLDFMNEETNKPYSNIIFAGENGCGKTAILKEIVNYHISEKIINKQVEEGRPLDSIFIRQDLKHSEIDKIIKNAIDGSYKNEYGQESLREKNSSEHQLDISRKIAGGLKNNRISNIFDNNYSFSSLIRHSIESIGITKVDSEYKGIHIDNFSSGEQEIILRFKYIENKISPHTDIVLLDEIETALHPKWQSIIIEYIKQILNGYDVQLFMATHSENILKSVLDKSDYLIIRLYKEDGVIKSQKHSSMDRVLPYVSFSEVQYIIFDIPTNDYHNFLFGVIQEKFNNKNIKDMDDFILSSEYYRRDKHYMETSYKTPYRTLPVYIRNKIHHPENKELPFDDKQLRDSIELLRKILKQANV